MKIKLCLFLTILFIMVSDGFAEERTSTGGDQTLSSYLKADELAITERVEVGRRDDDDYRGDMLGLSPSGEWLLLTSPYRDGLVLMNLRTMRVEQVYRMDVELDVGNIAWSADSRYIAFTEDFIRFFEDRNPSDRRSSLSRRSLQYTLYPITHRLSTSFKTGPL
jgi:hypothetical protein